MSTATTTTTEQQKKKLCEICKVSRPILKRPKTGESICKECFYTVFEDEIHHTIVDNQLFKRGDKVAIGASGGKDSTVLAEIMTKLNKKYDYGLDLFLLSIDEGITGYRDDSLETVKRNQEQYQIPLKILSYKELYNWTMDEIVKEIGLKNNCTFCGVFRRQALDRGAIILGANKIVTGHNADDIAETVLINLLRGDIPRLQRCVNIVTGSEGALPRSKPFKYTYQKEIVMYAYFKKLDYFSTECIYAPNAYRGHVRDFLKDLEAIRPSIIIDIIHSGENFHFNEEFKMPVQGTCIQCGYISSNQLCMACELLKNLNSGLAKVKLSLHNKKLKSTNPQHQLDENNNQNNNNLEIKI
ncbi:ATP-binding domain-containing protein 3 [Tieghemostelium lacteum]|uniref:Cytoplasmic tRNA 2-thiolation protein 1 n=1 Tax=Tieghemostelium lacteum TaxID=361077 RepID=A0A151Z2I8_TIELA|nr:ATP-binding domain-containing protein 3 [Tieghemostelium lacteum]|eukprot:KYQ88170.1 ATP-binding domain-containing protein 3 [Tieghemostelium lacteum]